MRNLVLVAFLLTAPACARITALAPTATLPATTIPPTATLAAAPTSTPAPTAAATRPVPPASLTPLPTPSEPVSITITAADGAVLAATYYPPIVRPAPAVLLLHMLGRSKADWDSFARGLQRQGYAALAIDLRGHGASAGPVSWPKGPGDVQAAWGALTARPEVDANRTGIVGASIGANLALMAAGAQPRVVAAVALSPGLDYHGLNPAASMANFGQRPVLLVASQDDPYSYNSAQSLAQLAIAAQTQSFASAGHGTSMFDKEPGLAPLLVDWLNKYVRDLKG